MSEEEKEAIENLDKLVYGELDGIIIKDIDGYTLWNTYLETILNLIQKQQEEIKGLKIANDEAWEEWNNLEQGSYEEEKRLKAELKKKDKIIDLILQDMIDQKCYSSSRTILKRIYEKKVEENSNVKNT